MSKRFFILKIARLLTAIFVGGFILLSFETIQLLITSLRICFVT
jgi:hypothetical protein